MERYMKVALITGGTGGIGRSLVKAFCEAGYAVAFTYKSNTTVAEELYTAYGALESAERYAVSKTKDEEAAHYYKDHVNPRMDALRSIVDTMETLTARDKWPMPTYGDIVFKINN